MLACFPVKVDNRLLASCVVHFIAFGGIHVITAHSCLFGKHYAGRRGGLMV